MQIQTKPYTYFFSDSISLKTGQSGDFDITAMTEAQLIDIIEGVSIGTIIVDDLEGVKKELEKKQGKVTTSLTSLNIDTAEIEAGILKKLEGKLGTLTNTTIENDFEWTTTDW